VRSIKLITVAENERGSEDAATTYRFCESIWKANAHTKFLAADGSWQVSDFQMLESYHYILPCGDMWHIELCRRSDRSGSGPP